MKITQSTANVLLIEGAERLDPVRVITENYEPGQGRIIIQCWDRAWCSAWFSMSGRTIEQFFIGCDSGYLHDNLVRGLHGMRKAAAKRDEDYLRRIIEAVQAALRAQAEGAQA